jgi:hypothetical protein
MTWHLESSVLELYAPGMVATSEASTLPKIDAASTSFPALTRLEASTAAPSPLEL